MNTIENMMKESEILDLLSQINIFEGISKRGLVEIAKIAEAKRMDKDEFIFREGDLGDALYMVLEGEVRVSRNLSGKDEETIAFFAKSEAFGEMSLVDSQTRSADAIVQEDALLLVITKEDFEELLLMNRQLASEILWNFVKLLSSRLRETNDKMAFLTAASF